MRGKPAKINIEGYHHKKRADGRYVQTLMIDGKQKFFYGKAAAEAKRKMAAHTDNKAAGYTFNEMAEQWEAEHFKEVEPGTKLCYTPALKGSKACTYNNAV